MSDASKSGANVWLDQALHDLPPRGAPAHLESRVIQALERRAVRPWWLRTFGDWPFAMRASFVGVCGVLMACGVFGGRWVTSAVIAHPALLEPHPFHQASITAGVLVNLAATLFDLIPPGWIRAALGAGALLYGALFALGAIAYRALYLGVPGKDGALRRLTPLNGG